MNKYLYPIIFLLTFIRLSGQTGFEDQKKPFVTGIEVYAVGGSILINWQNTDKDETFTSVYRSEKLIDNLRKAKKLVTLKNGEDKYIDTPAPGTYYYAVIITDKNGFKDFDILIPYRNTLPFPVTVEKEKTYNIKNIKTETDNRITLKWEYETDATADTNVLIFRNTKPISNNDILKESVSIGKTSISSVKFIDFPVPGINYYYAIIPENLYIQTFIPNMNYTTTPSNISAGINYLRSNNSYEFTPLPLLSLQEDPGTGTKFSDTQIFKSRTNVLISKKIDSIISGIKSRNKKAGKSIDNECSEKEKQLEIKMLPDEDIYKPGLYVDNYKNGIDNFKSKNYTVALEYFDNITISNTSDDILLRAYYYTGLCYYESGQYYNSYIYLLQSLEKYKKTVTPYIESSLYKIYNSIER